MEYTDERIGENAELKDEPTEPSKEEFNEVLKNLKQGKAPGPDDICSEFIQNGGPELRERLYKLMSQDRTIYASKYKANVCSTETVRLDGLGNPDFREHASAAYGSSSGLLVLSKS
ncbi:hypothetical protein QE152_g8955 [Popillia japonica]|uniref:Uncharacterized protein n=1 Tax=Popillia japonica TaxID=7064 RepID=A0AAW1LYV7_POPJA